MRSTMHRGAQCTAIFLAAHLLLRLPSGVSCALTACAMQTRRINHADAAIANVSAKIVNHHGVRKIALYANQAVAPGTELTYDYRYAKGGACAATTL